MAQKTLKDLFEVYKPKSPDEQKFVDKHVTIKHKDRNGNGDDVFNAANIKTNKRKEERHGYDVGEDEKVYEETDPYDVAGMIKKAKAKNDPKHPAMKHVAALEDIKQNGGALSVHGDHVRLLKKALGEEAEQVDELSKNTMLKYLSANKKSDKAAQEKGDYSKSDKRMRGTDVAVRKYTATDNKYIRVPATEEVEDFDALLGDALDMLNSIDEKTLTPAEMKKREEIVKAIKRDDPKMDKSMAYAIATKTAKRVAEDAKELEELSTDTLRKYRAKAKDDAYDAADVDDDRRLRKRSMGSWDAGKKILKRGDALRAEEIEAVDEISTDTLRGYMDKASDARGHRNLSTKKVDNRYAGVQKASSKLAKDCLLYTSPSPRDRQKSRMPSSA